MGARQSRRSVDITTTPKKEGIPAEGGVVSEGAEKIEKLGMIEEADAKPTSNGVAPHTDSAEDKDKDKDEATEKEQDKEKQPEETAEAVKEEAKLTEPSSGVVAPVAEVTAEAAPAEVTTPTEAAATPVTPATPATPNSTATTPDTKEAKKKDKSKKKWSFRSISFSRKDKSKPVREATPKNGDVAKEEPLAEGGEEAEVAAATTVEAASPEDKSTVSSPTEESKEEAKDEKSMSEEAATPASPVSPISPSSLAEEQPAKKEEPSIPAPLEVVAPAALPESKVEVSPGATSQPIAMPATAIISTSTSATSSSITERKTTEDTCLLRPSVTSSGVLAAATAIALPSSPPPTPVDPSPLQRAQQVAPSASALAEALKLPHESQQRRDHDDDLAREVVELEESLQRSLTSQLGNAAEPLEDEVPPPLPVSPAPAETSRIASFAATTMQESVAVILDNAVTTTLPEEALKPKPGGSLDRLPPPSPPAELLEKPFEDEAVAEFPLPLEAIRTARLHNGLHHGPEDELDDDEDAAAAAEDLEEDYRRELNLQCAPDPELVAAILENNLVVKSEIVPTENGVADEAPKSPPPAVPVEASQPAPAITEDVTSVTKAIEEIDISEKAVAAAVNENIESTGANEIVVDSIHQNNLNE